MHLPTRLCLPRPAQADRNHDGNVSREELKQLLRSHGAELAEWRLWSDDLLSDGLFDRFDVDSDGHLSKDEFEHMFKVPSPGANPFHPSN